MRLSAPIFRLKRQAKLLSRQEAIPLHEAQDRIARTEGFQRWSHLSARHAENTLGQEMLGQLDPGDLVLLAGMREQGKTTLAFHLIAEAVKQSRLSMYFSLSENGSDIEHRLKEVGVDPTASRQHVVYDTSEEISARYIVERCSKATAGALIVIDYLQRLDQQRRKPVVADQLDDLSTFARESQSIVVVLSQIDRTFDGSGKDAPDLEDIRLPNPVDLGLFSKSCFVHDGQVNVLVGT